MNVNMKNTVSDKLTHTFSTSNRVKAVLTTALLSITTAAFAGEKVDKTIDTSSSPKVDIEHIDGKADIRVWDKAQVRVTGELGDQTEEFIFEKRGDVVVIHVEVEHRSKSWYQKSRDGDDLIIYVPSASDLHYTAVNADVKAEGITKAVDVEVVNGNVTLENIGERVEVESVNGDILLKNVKGRLEAGTVNGDIEATHEGTTPVSFAAVNGKLDIASSSPDLSVETVNGRIDLSLQNIDSLQINTVNGRTFAKLGLNSNGSIKANSVGGAMEFVFQDDVSAQFDIETHAGGNIVNKISGEKAQKPKYGPGSWLRFIHNGGAASVDISTVHGRIEIDQK
ncbi:DUF4097 family beta strand repeat-containing protein [Alteromonas sp. S005]|uniref:DUF4097 family beta strand repeat-containing protein n=1 Tax=Alteromonas sp. S005 TaxID=3117400 RepID=UPI002FE06A6D